jgi:hypothetical protein
VEQDILMAVKALVERDTELARQIIDNGDVVDDLGRGHPKGMFSIFGNTIACGI